MEEVEVPQFFLCPISLQIMRDPVTVITGITYDRESIHQWLISSGINTAYCPVTKQVIPRDYSDLTPNHTLRRLIQAWCAANMSESSIPIMPKSPPTKASINKLLQDLGMERSQLQVLKKLEEIASEGENSRRCAAEFGVAKAMVSLIIKCFKRNSVYCLEEALRVLNLIITRVPINEITSFFTSGPDFLDSITWMMRCRTDTHKQTRTLAVSVLKSLVELESSNVLERLKSDLFEAVVWILTDRVSQQALKSALHVLLSSCPWGGNKFKIVEAGAVFQLIELELNGCPDKRTTELILGVLDHLCSCADGRAKFLGHAAGIAMITKRILRVSTAADDVAVRILSSICKFSGTGEVVQEMLRVGAVSKLCMVLQANEGSVKAKAREVLRLHNNVWSNSPCIQIYLLTRYTR
ncbi:hypothetical protein Sjap_012505 [Stephania japonica]|uniref:U-box domain-containing protein n=1 Tax=Stephania japonica TaxID=461633 RepID=A0AAP0NXP4_9MAGN